MPGCRRMETSRASNKISSRTRSALAKQTNTAPFVVEDVHSFLQDPQNLDLITMIMQLLLDSSSHYSFGYKTGGISAGIHNANKCVAVLVAAISMSCKLW